jgi:hypothetical protein
MAHCNHYSIVCPVGASTTTAQPWAQAGGRVPQPWLSIAARALISSLAGSDRPVPAGLRTCTGDASPPSLPNQTALLALIRPITSFSLQQTNRPIFVPCLLRSAYRPIWAAIASSVAGIAAETPGGDANPIALVDPSPVDWSTPE